MKINFKTIIEAMQKSPSGDNCQPFTYRINNGKIEVYHDSEIAKHLFNPDNIASTIAMGMQIASCRHALLAQGFEMSYDLDQEKLSAIITATEIQNKEDHLYDYIFLRHTDRRNYRVENELSDEFKKYVDDDYISFQDSISSDFLSHIFNQEKYMFQDFNAFSDVMEWIRYSKKDEERERTGFNLGNLVIDPFMAVVLKLYKRRTFLNGIIQKFLIFTAFLKVHLFYKKSAGFIHISVDEANLNIEEIVKAGEKAMNIWLQLTKEGYSAQPVSFISLLPYSQLACSQNRYQRDLQQSYKFLKDHLKLNSNQYPVFSLRYGKPYSPMKDKNKTLRRIYSDVVLD